MSGFGNPYGQNYATGGGAAGGFFAGGSQSDSPSGKVSAKNTLRPVTIRQVRTASQPDADAEFKIDGVDVGQITLCAAVRNISRNATNISYSVEDGTGEIEVRQWLDNSSDDAAKAPDIQQNQYIRILGTVKAFQSKRNISAGHIRPVDNYNEVLYHKLEVMWVHSQLTQGGGQQNGSGGVSQNNNVDYGSAGAGGGADFSHLSNPTQRKIASAIQALVHPDSEGITVAQVHGKLPQLSAAQITKEVEEMVNNGFLYHTIDDDHFLAP